MKEGREAREARREEWMEEKVRAQVKTVEGI